MAKIKFSKADIAIPYGNRFLDMFKALEYEQDFSVVVGLKEALDKGSIDDEQRNQFIRDLGELEEKLAIPTPPKVLGEIINALKNNQQGDALTKVNGFIKENDDQIICDVNRTAIFVFGKEEGKRGKITKPRHLNELIDELSEKLSVGKEQISGALARAHQASVSTFYSYLQSLVGYDNPVSNRNTALYFEKDNAVFRIDFKMKNPHKDGQEEHLCKLEVTLPLASITKDAGLDKDSITGGYKIGDFTVEVTTNHDILKPVLLEADKQMEKRTINTINELKTKTKNPKAFYEALGEALLKQSDPQKFLATLHSKMSFGDQFRLEFNSFRNEFNQQVAEKSGQSFILILERLIEKFISKVMGYNVGKEFDNVISKLKSTKEMMKGNTGQGPSNPSKEKGGRSL